MRIRMLTLAAGPGGVWRPGAEIELPDRQAVALVDGGYAVPVRQARETAAVGPGEREVLLARDIQGIGETRAAALEKLGIVTAKDLTEADAALIAAQIEGVGKNTAKRWIAGAREALGA